MRRTVLFTWATTATAATWMATAAECNGGFSPWSESRTDNAGAVFSLEARQGFFVQGDVRVQDPAHYPPRLGLQPERSWAQVDEELVANDDSKLVIFLRHGEALHNADKLRVGAEAWEQTYQFLDDYNDAPLTATGINQAVAAGAMLKTELEGGGLALDVVLVSPLDRTLNTYIHSCGDLQLSAPVMALEIVRETLGVCSCDARTQTSPKRTAFPTVDFSCIEDEEDRWWKKNHRETDDEIDERARQFLRKLFQERSEKRILVVTHSGFTRACLRVLGHRYYRPANGELIPVLVGSTLNSGRPRGDEL